MPKRKATSKGRDAAHVIFVTRASPQRIRKALRLLDRVEKGNGHDDSTKKAVKFYEMAKKFFKSGGRFRKSPKKEKGPGV